MLKHSTLIAGIILFLSTGFATEIESETWVFKGNFEQTLPHVKGRKLNRYFVCKNKSDNDSSLKTLTLAGYIDDTTRLIFSLKNRVIKRPEEFGSFAQIIKEIVEDHEEEYFFSISQKGSLVLEFLYYLKEIPDFVVDRLLKETDWTDFRLNDREENKNQENFEKFTHYYLSQINDFSKRSQIVKHLTQNLPQDQQQLKLKLSYFMPSKL